MNHLSSPPTPKGLDQAVQLLSIIADAKELSKLVDNLKKYNEEAKEYFITYGGLVKAKATIKEAETIAKNIIAEAEAKRQSFADSIKQQQSKIDQSNAKLTARAESIHEQISVVESREKAVVNREIELEKKSAELAELQAQVRTEKDALDSERDKVRAKQAELNTVARNIAEAVS